MPRIKGLRRKIYRMTYDRYGVNQRALKIKRSLDEVKNQLETFGRKKR